MKNLAIILIGIFITILGMVTNLLSDWIVICLGGFFIGYGSARSIFEQ